MQDLHSVFGTESLGHFLPTASILLSPLQLKPRASGDGGAGFVLSQSCRVPTDPEGRWAWLLQGWQVTAVL